MTKEELSYQNYDLIVHVDFYETIDNNTEQQHEELAILQGQDKKHGFDKETWIVKRQIWHEDHRPEDQDLQTTLWYKSEGLYKVLSDIRGTAAEAGSAYQFINADFQKRMKQFDLLDYIRTQF